MSRHGGWGQDLDKERLPGKCRWSNLAASADVDVRAVNTGTSAGGFPGPVGEAVPAAQAPSAQETPSSGRERHRAQGSGPGRKSTTLFSIIQKSLGSPFGVFLFPEGVAELQMPPRHQRHLMYLTHGGLGKEVAHRHSLCESRLGPDQGRQGGCSQAPRARARGQAPEQPWRAGRRKGGPDSL